MTMAMVTVARAMAMATSQGAGRATTRAMTAAMTVAAMRVVSNEEDEGGKAMETVCVCVCV